MIESLEAEINLTEQEQPAPAAEDAAEIIEVICLTEVHS